MILITDMFINNELKQNEEVFSPHFPPYKPPISIHNSNLY